MAHGGNVWQGASPDMWLDFSANIRPGGAPDWVCDALICGMDDAAYYPDPLMKRASAAMAVYLNLPEDCVRPTAGGISALDMAMGAADGGALLAAPCFSEYEWLAQKRGLSVDKRCLLDGRDMRSPAEALCDAITPDALVVLCNPNNPTGRAFSRDEVLALLDRVERAGAYLLVDEAFIGYCPENSVCGLLPEARRLIVAGSMTKLLGVPGVRLGYLCAEQELLRRLTRYQLTWELNCFAGSIACALPNHKGDMLADAAINARRRDWLVGALNELGIYVYDSQAAFVLADFTRDVRPIVQALHKKGILVRECMDFEGIADGRHLRLAVKDEDANARLISALREVI